MIFWWFSQYGRASNSEVYCRSCTFCRIFSRSFSRSFRSSFRHFRNSSRNSSRCNRFSSNLFHTYFFKAGSIGAHLDFLRLLNRRNHLFPALATNHFRLSASSNYHFSLRQCDPIRPFLASKCMTRTLMANLCSRCLTILDIV